MATVGAVMDRIYREWLHKLGNQPLGIELESDVDASVLSWTLAEGLTAEELSYPKTGTVLECGSEQVRVFDWDPSTRVATFHTRGHDGTTPAPHAAGDVVLIDPPYPRNALFGALGDEIVGLHPELWAIRTIDAAVLGSLVELPSNAEGFLFARDFDGNAFTGPFLTGYSGVDSGRAAVLDFNAPGLAWVTYSTGFERPTSEADELSDLGVEDRWQQILIVSVVSSQLRGQELDLTTIEFLTEAIEASGVRIGMPTDVATALLRWRQVLISNARTALLARTGITSVTTRVI